MDRNLPQVDAVPVQIQQVSAQSDHERPRRGGSASAAERRIIISTRSLKGERWKSVCAISVPACRRIARKVFDHFFHQADGMGMGLTVVRSIVETHGGTISAENAPDCGRAFLPPARSARRHKSQAA